MFRSQSLISRLFSMPLTAIATSALVSVSMLAAPVTYAATKSTVTKTSAKKQATATKSTKKVASAKERSSSSRKVIVLRHGKKAVMASRAQPVRAAFVPSKPTLAEAMGLRDTEDALALRSSVALVLDQNTNEVLFQKNPTAVLPIASITKLMTALVVMDSRLPMDEVLTVSEFARFLS